MHKLAAALELAPRLLNGTSHELDRFLVVLTTLKCQKKCPRLSRKLATTVNAYVVPRAGETQYSQTTLE